MLQDVYGNTYTYGHLGTVAKRYPSPKPKDISPEDIEREMKLPARDAAPDQAASATDRPASRAPEAQAGRARRARGPRRPQAAAPRRRRKERLFAHPARPNASAAGGAQQEFERTGVIDGAETVEGYFQRVFGLSRDEIELKRLRPGARVVAGTVLGRLGARGSPRAAPAVRDPAGRPRRPARRPEADPRRLEAARVDRDLPRGRQEPVLRRRRRQPVDRADPADEQGGAGPARAEQPADRHLRVRPARHPRGPDRPPRAGDARVPLRVRPAADRHLAASAATAT